MNDMNLNTTSHNVYNPRLAGARRQIEYGDRVFVRIRRGCDVLLELSTNRVGDYSELLVEIQRQTRDLRGLATLQVRNSSRGWVRETPYMLGSVASPRGRQAAATAPAHSPAPAPRRRMLMPFETH